jgi:hypothetical protein
MEKYYVDNLNNKLDKVKNKYLNNFALIFFKYLKYQLYFKFVLFGKAIKTAVLTRESMNCIIIFFYPFSSKLRFLMRRKEKNKEVSMT